MRISRIIFATCLVLILLSGNAFSAATIYDGFVLTNDAYYHSTDINKVISDEFGDSFKVADWNELKSYYNTKYSASSPMTNFFGEDMPVNGFVTRNGQRYSSGSRHYFATLTPPGAKPFPSYLSFDNAGNHNLDLGSWYTTQKVVGYSEHFADNGIATISDRGQKEAQTLFLDFSSGKRTVDRGLGELEKNWTAANYLTNKMKDSITAHVQSLYSPFNVVVTSEKPSAGSYSTIFYGGDPGSLGEGTGGTALKIDYKNRDYNDVAYVLDSFQGSSLIEKVKGDLNLWGYSNDFISFTSPETLVKFYDEHAELGSLLIERYEKKIAETIAHEAGHLFGLFHVKNYMDVMYPSGGARLKFSSFSETAYIDPFSGRVIGNQNYLQDNYAALAENVGLNGGVLVDFFDDPLSTTGTLSALMAFPGAYFSKEFYDVAFDFYMKEDDDFSKISFVYEDSNMVDMLEMAAMISMADSFSISGSSVDGGELDIFSSTGSDDLIPVASMQSLDALNFELYQSVGDQVASYGTFTVQAVPTPEPSTFILLGAGIAGIVAYSRKKQKSGH